VSKVKKLKADILHLTKKIAVLEVQNTIFRNEIRDRNLSFDYVYERLVKLEDSVYDIQNPNPDN